MPAAAQITAGRLSFAPLLLLILLVGMGRDVRAQVTATPERLSFECTVLELDSAATITLLSPNGAVVVRAFALRRGAPFIAPPGPRPEGDTLRQGEASTYTVRFDPNALGSFRDTLRVLLYHPALDKRDSLLVPLFGTSVPRPGVQISPRGDLQFGAVTVDSTTLRTIYLSDTSCRSITLDTVEVKGDNSGSFRIVAEPRYPRHLADGERDSIVVEFNPDRPGEIGSELRVQFDRGLVVSRRVVGFGTQPALFAYTSTVNFGSVPLGAESRPRNALVMNRGGAPLTIDSVWVAEGDTALFHLAIDFTQTVVGPARNDRDTNRMLQLPFVFVPKVAGSFSATVRVRSVEQGVVEIQLLGVGSVGVALRPDRLDMGLVPVGTTGTFRDTITIENNEPTQLLVDAITWEGGDSTAFGLPAAPFSVAPNSRRQISVSFKPDAPRGYEASALFHLGNSGSRLRLRLRGQGGAPRLEWLDPSAQFGPVPFGFSSVPDTLRLVNLGEVAVEIDTVQIAGPDAAHFELLSRAGRRLLRPNGADTLRCVVAFAPLPPGAQRHAVLVVRGGGGERERQLDGTGVPGQLVEPRLIDFDTVLVSSTDTLLGKLRVQGGPDGLHITDVEVRGPDSAAFDVLGPRDRTIGRNDETTFDLTFRPDAVRSYAALLVLHLNDRRSIRVLLQGRGVAFVRRNRFVWIDTASADVNHPFVLRLRVAPPLRAEEDVRRITAALVADRRALHFLGAEDPSVTATLRDDTLLIDRTGSPIVGDVIASLRFEGLVTGQPSNTVALRSAVLPPLADSVQRSGGIVFLNGCDVGRGVVFGRSARVVGLSPQPAGSVAVLRYVAPEGTFPSVHVVDAAGGVRETFSLPAGTGAEQSGEIRLDELPAGLYLLELRVGSQRSSIPVVLGER